MREKCIILIDTYKYKIYGLLDVHATDSELDKASRAQRSSFSQFRLVDTSSLGKQ